jgi:hypothetical protein
LLVEAFCWVFFAVEYDYRFRTNNLGLARDADVAPGLTSLLLLGDSFTEGQCCPLRLEQIRARRA